MNLFKKKINNQMKDGHARIFLDNDDLPVIGKFR